MCPANTHTHTQRERERAINSHPKTKQLALKSLRVQTLSSMALSTKPLLIDLLTQNCSLVPANYVRPRSDRPNLLDVQVSDDSIPLIDLGGLTGSARSEVVKAIGLACQDDSFFQVHMLCFMYFISLFKEVTNFQRPSLVVRVAIKEKKNRTSNMKK